MESRYAGMKKTIAGANGGSRAPVPPVREAEYAARWEAGWWRGRVVRTERDDRYTVIYQGRRGGGPGPDFRDAVLARSDGVRVHGDVELHLRAADWRAHGHDTDRRYAAVVLHIVFTPLPPLAGVETPLPLGGAAPIAVLDCDLAPGTTPAAGTWPCTRLASRLGRARLRTLLLHAGHERFALREARFLREIAEAEIHASTPDSALWTPRDRVLFVGIAEALGYGRDRDALRAAGATLVSGRVCDVAALTSLPGRIERSRVSGLLNLHMRWRERGPWRQLSEHILTGPPRVAAAALSAALRSNFGRISPGRARIIAANVVLPFASAVAALEGDTSLGARARAVYEVLPGLPSNAITRLMARQLGLARLPTGAAVQQGLQHVWAEWCREKHCESCPCAGTDCTPAVTSPHHVPVKPATLVGDVGL